MARPVLPDGERDLPRVVVAEHVIDKIVRAAPLYPGFETGEAMVGLILPQSERVEPDIYILDTIAPDLDAIRQWGMFEQGGDWQGDVFDWLYHNWESYRKVRRASGADEQWDLPLSFVGDWHKQPGDMVAPSGGDLATARAQLADSETIDQQLVAPIITMYRLRPDIEDEPDQTGEPSAVEPAAVGMTASEQPGAEATPAAAAGDAATSEHVLTPLDAADQAAAIEQMDDDEDDLFINENAAPPDPTKLPPNALVRTTADEKWLIRIDFWYLSTHLPRFAPVKPIIWADDRLPDMPPVAWHLLHQRRFSQEIQLLTDAGYVVDYRRWDADGQPPYEVCFYVYKPGSWNVYLLVTSVDYPNQMPAMRVSPLVSAAEDEDMFEKVYEASRPLLLDKQPNWEWDSKRTLIELVWHIEKMLNKEEKA